MWHNVCVEWVYMGYTVFDKSENQLFILLKHIIALWCYFYVAFVRTNRISAANPRCTRLLKIYLLHHCTHLLTLSPPNYSIWIFTHLKLCLADAIHNFKWVKIIQIWQNGRGLFSNLADYCHFSSSICLKANKKCINRLKLNEGKIKWRYILALTVFCTCLK